MTFDRVKDFIKLLLRQSGKYAVADDIGDDTDSSDVLPVVNVNQKLLKTLASQFWL